MSGPFGGPPPSQPPYPQAGPPPSTPPPPPSVPPGYVLPPGYGGPPPPGYGRPSWAPAQPGPSKMGSGKIVAVFVGALLALVLVAGAFVVLNQGSPPVAPCPVGQPCAPVPSLPPVASSPLPIGTPGPVVTPGVPGASLPPGGPTSNADPALSGSLYTDSSLGYGFEYDPDVFELGNTTDGSAILNGKFFDCQIWIDAKSADTSPAKMIETELADIDRFLLARVPDTDTYDALLGPSIGYVPGQGGVWSGTLTGRDGSPLAPGGIAIVSSTDGRITVAVVVIVGTPDARQGGDTQEHAVRGAADDILKTFKWNLP